MTVGDKLREAVVKLHNELAPLADPNNFEVGDIHTFGLEFDVFDPVTGTLISAARAHRRDIGDFGILKTVAEVLADINSGRRHLGCDQSIVGEHPCLCQQETTGWAHTEAGTEGAWRCRQGRRVGQASQGQEAAVREFKETLDEERSD